MASRRRQRQTPNHPAVTVSLALCILRCRDYADKSRAKGQLTLADVYEGFILLLQEYAEDVTEGLSGRVVVNDDSL